MFPKPDKELTTLNELQNRLVSVLKQYETLNMARKSFIPSDAMLKLEQRADAIENRIREMRPYPRIEHEAYYVGFTLAEYVEDCEYTLVPSWAETIDYTAYKCDAWVSESPDVAYWRFTGPNGYIRVHKRAFGTSKQVADIVQAKHPHQMP